MKLSQLIGLLEEIKIEMGDLEIKAFQHEGGNSLRAYPSDIDRNSFVFNEGEENVLTIGGYYK